MVWMVWSIKMGWVSISAVFGRVVVSRDTTCLGCSTRAGFAAQMAASLSIKSGAFDPARFPLLWNPWAWLAVLPTLLAVRICVSLVWRSSPNNHSVTGTLAEQRPPYSLFSWCLMSSLRSWTISKLTWPRSCIASVACTSKLCSSPAKLLSALADRLSSDPAVFDTTQPAFVTLLCRRENLTSRDLALRDNFPQISSLTFGTTTNFQV